MNTLLVFVVRLILGLAFGIIIVRMFRPEWGFLFGIGAGIIFVALAYGMQYFRKSKSE